MISKRHYNTQKTCYHELKEMDSANDASELPPLYHGLIHCDQCLHGTLPRKTQATLKGLGHALGHAILGNFSTDQ